MSAGPQQNLSDSPAKRVIDHIVERRFTGLLRARAREAEGEFWFLAGIREEARFGVSKDDDAVARLLTATDLAFEAEPRLPGITGGFKKRLPLNGTFDEIRPVALMRHCESYALTCTL